MTKILSKVPSESKLSLTLKELIGALALQKAEYRICGSLLFKATNPNFSREIGDIDVIIEKKHLGRVLEDLKQKGYSTEKRSAWEYSWCVAKKKERVEIEFLFIGKFTKEGFIIPTTPPFSVKIPSLYLGPVKYSFEGINFVGATLEFSLLSAKLSNDPKRKEEKALFIKNKVHLHQIKKPPFVLQVFGKDLPLLYELFSFLYERLGKRTEEEKSHL